MTRTIYLQSTQNAVCDLRIFFSAVSKVDKSLLSRDNNVWVCLSVCLLCSRCLIDLIWNRKLVSLLYRARSAEK